MSTNTTINPVSLIGAAWTDDKGRSWDVRRLNGGHLRAVQAKSGRGKDMTVDEVLAAVEQFGGTIPDSAAGAAQAVIPQPVDASEMVGRKWTTPDGDELTVTGLNPDLDEVEGGWVLIAVDQEGNQDSYSILDVLRGTLDPRADWYHPLTGDFLGAPETVPTLSETVPTFSSVDEKPDTSLAGAGAEADEQYRQRQMDPASKPPRRFSLPANVIAMIERQVNDLLPLVFRHNNRGTVTLNIRAKRGDSDREADIRYEVKVTPPKEQVDGLYWAGGELGDTGVPKREPDNQVTVFDVPHQDGDDEPPTNAPISERIAADETADPGDADDANPRADGDDQAAKMGIAQPAGNPEGVIDDSEEVQ